VLGSSGGSLGQRWQLPDGSLPPGAADVLEAEEELRRLGLLPPEPAAADAAADGSGVADDDAAGGGSGQ
jgi:hypothetical protein